MTTNGAPAAPFVRSRMHGVMHNRHMSRLRPLFLFALLPMLAACEPIAPPAGPATDTATASAMEFRGERACVDCLGIQAWLRLEDAGSGSSRSARHYRMTEVYLGDDRERRYEDEGEWTSQGDLLRLQSREGGVRVYARQPDGSLQARGQRGQRLAGTEDDMMIPVTFDTGG